MDRSKQLFDNESVARAALDDSHFSVSAHMLSLWDAFHPYADPTFAKEIRDATAGLHEHDTPGPKRNEACDLFQRRWWEMFVAVVLLDQGITLVPRKNWDSAWKGAGPDILASVDGKRVWIECIAPGAGEGPDGVPELTDKPIDNVPVNQIKLRLTGAIRTKRNQLAKHVNAEIVKSEDAYVIAVNARCISPLVITDDDPPWIARSLYGLGPLAVKVDMHMNLLREPFIQPQLTIPRIQAPDDPVDANLFGSGEAPEVSGVLYSTLDAWNCPADPHPRLSFVHNRTAIVALPMRWLPKSVSYAVTMNGNVGTITKSDPTVAP